MLQRWKHGRRCRKLAKTCPQPVLGEYLAACGALQFGHIANTPLIAVDLELSGLDKERDRIIAIGWTLIDGGRIQTASNRRLLIYSGQTVVPGTTIHALPDNDVAGRADPEAGLEALFSAARGRVWVFHHAGLDIGFLKKACQAWATTIPGFIVLDTLRIEYRLRKRREVPVKRGDLQLGKIRNSYGLPRYSTRNAMTDAIAAAELMLAIAAHMETGRPLELRTHLKFF